MDNENSRNKVIETIKKLFALAGNNTSENEAIAAALKAQQLMAKNNIDDAEIADEVKEESIETLICEVGIGKKWKYQLGNLIAKNFRCKCFCEGRWGICFYGHKSDIQIAEQVFLYLFKTGDRLANKYIRNYKRDFPYDSTIGLYNSFVIGFLEGVRTKMEKQCMALMIVIPEKVEKAYCDYSKDFGKLDLSINLNSDFSEDAFKEGKFEGKLAMDGRELEKRESSKKFISAQ